MAVRFPQREAQACHVCAEKSKLSSLRVHGRPEDAGPAAARQRDTSTEDTAARLGTVVAQTTSSLPPKYTHTITGAFEPCFPVFQSSG